MTAARAAAVSLAVLAAAGTARLPAQELGTLAAQYSGCDVDGDGSAEIVRLAVLHECGDAAAPRVVVLVEDRLLAPRVGVDPAHTAALRAGLQRFATDLAAAGHRAALVGATVYAGPRHQDGRTVLGLRRFLQACRAAAPLAGAILVGHFPDALLLRTCNWRKQGALDLPGRDGQVVHLGQDTRYLRRITELVAHKCDLVLADLDGDWEALYRCEMQTDPGVVAAFAERVPAAGGAYVAAQANDRRHADAFHVADGRVQFDPDQGTLTIDDATRDAECTAADRQAPNPLAHPEIAVSRLDARGVAWSPRPELLDAAGAPTRAAWPDGVPAELWQPDPDLEVRLLVEYLQRNHRFRGARDPAHDKPASIAWGLGSGMPALRAAAAAWRDFAADGYDVRQQVDLLALVQWLQRPAVLRTLRAHSNGSFAAFARTDAAALTALTGTPWCWQLRGNEAVPSFAAACRTGRADCTLYRTLWQHRLLPDVPYLLLHTGCEAISPPGAQRLPYDAPAYGRGQQAEALLFYTPCLALLGRAKVFYDEPREFGATLAQGGTLGAAWQRYFACEAASSWREAGGDIGRKRAYFWSMLGDFTLRLWP